MAAAFTSCVMQSHMNMSIKHKVTNTEQDNKTKIMLLTFEYRSSSGSEQVLYPFFIKDLHRSVKHRATLNTPNPQRSVSKFPIKLKNLGGEKQELS